MATAAMFQRGWLWVRDNGETEISLFGGGDFNEGLRRADSCGVSFCIKLQDGQVEVNAGLPDLIRTRRESLGLSPRYIMGWSTNRSDPVADAAKTNGLIYRSNVAGWVSECEEYKGAPGSEPWNRLSKFVDTALGLENSSSMLRNFMLNIGRWGFCYLPNEPAGPYLDWDSVKRAKGRGVPECYPNQFPTEPSQWPREAIELASRPTNALFPRSYMHPLVGLHRSLQEVRLSAYVDSLLQSQREGYFTKGFSIFGISDMTGADIAVLRQWTKPAGTVEALNWY